MDVKNGDLHVKFYVHHELPMLPGQGWLVAVEAQLEFRGKKQIAMPSRLDTQTFFPHVNIIQYLPLIHTDTY